MATEESGSSASTATGPVESSSSSSPQIPPMLEEQPPQQQQQQLPPPPLHSTPSERVLLGPIPEDRSDPGLIGRGGGGPSLVAPSVASQYSAAATVGRRGAESVISDAVADIGGGDDHDHDGQLREQEQQQPARPPSSRRTRKKRFGKRSVGLLIGFCVVATIAVVIGLVASDSNRHDDDDDDDDDEPNPPSGDVFDRSISVAPTMAPSVNPPTVARLDEVIDSVRVTTSSNTDPAAQAVLEQAHQRTRKWLLEEDLFRNEVLAEPTGIRLTQRYVVSLLAFSLNISANEFDVLVPESSECNWSGVFCESVTLSEGAQTSLEALVVRRISWRAVINITSGTTAAYLPAELQSLPFLQELELSQNGIQGSLPAEWFDIPAAGMQPNASVVDTAFLPQLFFIDLSENSLVGAIPPLMWSMPSLRFAYLNHNNFNGDLPTDLAAVANGVVDRSSPSSFLQDAFLHNNSLTGNVPTWLSRLERLERIVAENNQFSGPLWPGLTAAPPRLRILDFSFNGLTGAIPQPLFESNTLQSLYLDNNRFDQVIPASSATGGSSLVRLWLHGNLLVGPIPETLGAGWSSLQDFFLQQNPTLSGTVPAAGCQTVNVTTAASDVVFVGPFWPSLANLAADCLDTDRIVCECCTMCL